MPFSARKKLQHLPYWSMMTPGPAPVSGNSMGNSLGPDQTIYFSYQGAVYLYDPWVDAWSAATGSGATGSIFSGDWGYDPYGPTGTAQVGSGASNLLTTLTVNANLRPRGGRRFPGRVTGGTGAGQEFEILNHSSGSNASFSIEKPQADGGGPLATALDNTSTFVLFTGAMIYVTTGAAAAGIIRRFDYATQTWSSMAVTGLPTLSGESRIVATPSIYAKFHQFTASAGGASTATDGAANWATNQWANSQARIKSGTGAGQVRSIASNTASVLTVGSAWTTPPDATSVIVIEGNDDYIYLTQSGAVGLYRWSRSGNTWSLLSPTAARAGAPAAGHWAEWIYGCTGKGWSDTNAIKNGRYIQAMRPSAMDQYDIALNTWISGITVGLLAGGGISDHAYDGADTVFYGYSRGQNYIFDLVGNCCRPGPVTRYVTGAVGTGNLIAVVTLDSGDGVPMRWLYKLFATTGTFMRYPLG